MYLSSQVQNFAQHWRAYFELCKPNVVALMLLTAIVGMFMASPGMVPMSILLWGSLGIMLVASAGAVFNHVCDQNYDAIMHRTKYRPLPTGQVSTAQALGFAFVMAVVGTLILAIFVNFLTASLTFMTMIGYAVVYTLFLKHQTSQNIVIGGLAGATPPLLGWTAVAGHPSPEAYLMVLIIFTWTPPHFWALAIHRYKEYEQARIPMLPVTHGIGFTKLSILLYTVLLLCVSIMPFVIGASGLIYLAAALILGGYYVFHNIRLIYSNKPLLAMKSFRYSIVYLSFIFIFLLVDHYFLIF